MNEGEELNFNFSDEDENSGDNNSVNSNNIDNINNELNNDNKMENFDFLRKEHKNIGMKEEEFETLIELLNAKNSDNSNLFPDCIFVKILKIIKNQEINAQRNLNEFYLFIYKCIENIINKDLNDIKELENKKKNTIINFWKKKLTARIFNNMISKRKIKPSYFENEI